MQIDQTPTRPLVVLGCSRRKKHTSGLIPAIARYDGPLFQVLRKHVRNPADRSVEIYILSARFGLISGKALIPFYNHRLHDTDHVLLRAQVGDQLKQILDELQPERLFISVGCQYWSLLKEPLSLQVPRARLFIARGGIGGRASQLARWLRIGEPELVDALEQHQCGVATLLGTTVRLNRTEVMQEAQKALRIDSIAAHRFESWYVPVGADRLAPKWLVSRIFHKPVRSFRTADARRVLYRLGVSCNYADH